MPTFMQDDRYGLWLSDRALLALEADHRQLEGPGALLPRFSQRRPCERFEIRTVRHEKEPDERQVVAKDFASHLREPPAAWRTGAFHASFSLTYTASGPGD